MYDASRDSHWWYSLEVMRVELNYDFYIYLIKLQYICARARRMSHFNQRTRIFPESCEISKSFSRDYIEKDIVW